MELFKNKIQLLVQKLFNNNLRLPQENLITYNFGPNYQKLLAEIFRKIKKFTDPILILKFATLIHKIILTNEFQQYAKLRECLSNIEFSRVIQRIIQKQHFQAQQYWDYITTKKTFLPYWQYLQSRILKNEWLKEPEDLKNIQLLLQKIFEYINLIHKGCMFMNEIKIFARYYKERYQFIEDINIFLAKDLQRIYNKLNRHFYTLWKRQNFMLISPNKWKIMLILLDQIDNLKQKLYPVYLNIYYHDSVNNYMPYWIKIDSNVITELNNLIKNLPSNNESLTTRSNKKLLEDRSTGNETPIRTDQPKIQINDFVNEFVSDFNRQQDNEMILVALFEDLEQQQINQRELESVNEQMILQIIQEEINQQNQQE